MAKAGCQQMIDAEVRRCGEQTGLDTLVVRTVNDAHWVSAHKCGCRSKRDKCAAWGVRPGGVLNAFAWSLTVYRQRRALIVYGADYQGI